MTTPHKPGPRLRQLGRPAKSEALMRIVRLLTVVVTLYAFLVSIHLMGAGLKMLGAGFAERLIATTSSPFAGLFIGILTTSLVQSSSTTTSMTVGFVATGILSIEHAIPIIMGANIGTTVTNTIVSLGHMPRRQEFERALAAATVHDFFNVMAVAILFPLEMATGFLRKSATLVSTALVGADPVHFASPVKAAVKPVSHAVCQGVESVMETHAPIAVAVLGLLLLLVSLYVLVRLTRRLALGRAEIVLDRCMGRGGLTGMALGAGLTAIVQSSSITTSLMVPLAGAGIVRLKQIFPITLGANVGTTVTALLASLSGDCRGLTIALVHLLFNLAGIVLIYTMPPVRRIPMLLATKLGGVAARSKRYAVIYLVGLFYVLPALLVVIDRLK